MRRICHSLILIVLLSGCASVRDTALSLLQKPTVEARTARKPESIGESKPTLIVESELDRLPLEGTGEEGEEGETGLRVASEKPEPAADASQDSLDLNFIKSVSLQTAGEPVAGTAGEPVAGTDESYGRPQPETMEGGSAAPSRAADAAPNAVQFDSVVSSVYRSFPLLQAALYTRNVALGQQIGAAGAFDLKLKAQSDNGPVGFYQTYRQSIGVVQPTYWGGDVFAGYRRGTGDFQPWYLERQTNGGGEFRAGVQIPLAQNREIDSRRAELWKAGFGRSMAEPDIQAQLIEYVQDASYAYWDWVAAGENYRIAARLLWLAQDRTSRIKAQVDAGFVDPPELTDNLRMVSTRQAKVADTRRKLEQTAAKLSIYWRDSLGEPIVATEDQLPGFPEPEPVDDDQLGINIQQAISRRPELKLIDLMRQQIQVDYSQAVNQLQPEVTAIVWGAQDVGEPTSSKRDKSPFDAEAAVHLDVPIQRRKARGKMTETQGKLAQLAAKRRITADKISVDVQMAHAALKSAWEQVGFTREALAAAEDLAARERANQEAGSSDLLKVSLRELYAVESAEKNVEALKLYFESLADYRAALAEDEIDR